jgi:nitroimidazol reductase NimA-like FMN-containing flavoprotein (pyridoxamine 5'-phosphate oxidase superfamily)
MTDSSRCLHLVEAAPVALDRNGLEVLTRDECLRLLGEKSVGRLGLTVGALPTVIPVNYRLIGDRVYFRTSTSERIRAATNCAVVAFEVDAIDEERHDGWTVVVTGVTEPIEHRDNLERLEEIGVPQWTPADQPRLVSISTEVMAGRRLSSQ